MAVDPVLLVLNADTCSPCHVLMHDQSHINQSIHNTYPDMRVIWVCVDRMNFSIFPEYAREVIKHVPIVMYFPLGMWEEYLRGHLSDDVFIMDSEAMQRYGECYSEETILAWLKDCMKCERECRGIPLTVLPEMNNELCCGPMLNLIPEMVECDNHMDNEQEDAVSALDRFLLNLMTQNKVRNPDGFSFEALWQGNFIKMGYDCDSGMFDFSLENAVGKTMTSLCLKH